MNKGQGYVFSKFTLFFAGGMNPKARQQMEMKEGQKNAVCHVKQQKPVPYSYY